jgi:NAD(P)-dependent dehydrogenase (short-subunit alcohol dehydrogenase family)
MAGELAGMVAYVTGGASGIGEATVRRFVEEGASVVVGDLQQDRGEALAAELGADRLRFLRVDVTDEADQRKAVELAVSTFGRLDVAFANAGIIGAIGPLTEIPVEEYDFTMDVLVKGVFLTFKQAAMVMVEQGSGCLLATSSIAGLQGGLGPHVYTAAKHAVIGLVKAAAAELTPLGIRVNAVAPTGIATPMVAALTYDDPDAVDQMTEALAAAAPSGRAGLATDIAEAALYLASPRAGLVSGHTLVLDLGRTTTGGTRNFFRRAELRREGGQKGIG